MKLENDCMCVICEFNDGTGTCLANPHHDECGICTTRKLKYNTDTTVSKNDEQIVDLADFFDSSKYANAIKKIAEEQTIKSIPPGILGNTD